MKKSHRILWPAIIALMAGSAPAPAQEQYLWLEEAWRPVDEPIVEVHYEEVTDEDVFLWQILNDSAPEAARLRPNESGQLEPVYPDALRQSVESLAEARVLAYLPEAEEGLPRDIGRKAARIAAARVAMVVFADYMVLPDVDVTNFDIANYYQENIARYSSPAVIEAFALEIPVTDPLDPEMREQARRRALELRREAISGGGLVETARRHQELASPRKKVAHQGQEDLPPAIEDALFKLAASQISTPQFFGDNVVLYEIESRQPAEKVPLARVAPEIAERLKRRIFAQQMRFRVAERIEHARPVSRAQHFALLEDDMLLLQVNDFMLSKGEFLALYPEYSRLQGKTPADLKQKVDEIVRGEVITQYLQGEGLLAAPRYERALELATELVYSRNAARNLQQKAAPTEEEIARYLESNRDRLAPASSRYIWKLEGRPRRVEELSASRRRELQARIRERMQPMIQEAQRLLEERSRISGEVAYVSPQFVLDRLIGSQPEEYGLVFERIGTRTPAQAVRELGIDFSQGGVGIFTPIVAYNDGSVVAYYFADEVALEAPPEQELTGLAREALVREAGRQPAVDELNRLRARAAMQWYVTFP